MPADPMHALALKLQETAEAHRNAHGESHGRDPNWARWYADCLDSWLRAHFSLASSKTQVASALEKLDHEYRTDSHDGSRAEFFARRMLESLAPAADNDTLALYFFRSCPYCVRVLRVIDELGIDVELRDIFTDPSFGDELSHARGRTTVPVLLCTSPDGSLRWMPESRDIVSYLRRRFG